MTKALIGAPAMDLVLGGAIVVRRVCCRCLAEILLTPAAARQQREEARCVICAKCADSTRLAAVDGGREYPLIPGEWTQELRQKAIAEQTERNLQ